METVEGIPVAGVEQLGWTCWIEGHMLAKGEDDGLVRELAIALSPQPDWPIGADHEPVGVVYVCERHLERARGEMDRAFHELCSPRM